ncbi:MAG: YceI family protein [Bacteroidia bacterium]
MKIQLFAILAIVALALASCGKSAPDSAKGSEAGKAATAAAAATTFTIDSEASKLGWIGTKPTGQHNGSIKIASGTMNMEGANLTAGEFTLDMNSITVLDLPREGDHSAVDLEGHLKSDDFFSVAANPTATFVITSVEAVEGEGAITHNINGNLTIKGITKQIAIPAAVSVAAGTFTADANFSFDRTDFDITYKSGNFFKELGDKTINDEVKMELVLVAKANAA